MTIIRRILVTILALGWVQVATAQDKAGVLVLGGTGRLGAEVVKVLAAKGEAVTVLARADSKRDLLASLKVDYVVGDLMNPAEVAAAVKSKPLRAIINTVRVEDGDIHFYEKLFNNLLPASKAAGVKQIIHHSAVGAGDNAKNFTDQGWESRPDMMNRLKDQGVGESLLTKSGITFTIIRNSRIWPETTPATGKAMLTEDQTVISPMTRADLAKLTVDCLDNPACAGKIYHVKDPSLTWPPPRMQ
ncbi:MAG: NAD(P)H-binding protein [Rhodospirillaceae bacterium]|nr:NAD(P)H-binding protein [Rhodospirillaceae bacterium]